MTTIFKVLTRQMSGCCKPLKRVGIVGVPFEKGQKKYGVSIAPAALRSVGLIAELSQIEGLDIKDYGDVEFSAKDQKVVDNMAHLPLVSACNQRLSEKVSEILEDGRIAISIGGDHSIGVGKLDGRANIEKTYVRGKPTANGLYRLNLGSGLGRSLVQTGISSVDGHYNVNNDMILIWVDAHADVNTNKTSESGSVHGMPVALLIKEFSDYWPYLPTMDWQVPKLSVKSLGYIGLRSVDEYERLAIEKFNIPTFAMEDIDEYGVKASIRHILDTLDPDHCKPIHVSFDIDSLDALEAPSTGTPVRGGLTLREAICMMEIIHCTGRLRAIDLVEINPALGNEIDRNRTIAAGISVLKAALGFSRRGTAPRGVKDLPVQTCKK